MILFKLDTWENGGRWYCGCLSCLGTAANQWWAIARVLNISLGKLVLLLKKDFNAKVELIHNEMIIYSFSTSYEADKFKTYVNKIAKEKHFTLLV